MKKSVLCVGGIVLLGIIVAVILIFRKPTYEVSFISDDKILDTVKVKEDGTIYEPKTPVKEGYDFVGWYSDTEKFDFSTKITEDITLEARWVKTGNKLYTVSFDSQGGNTISSIEVEEDMTASLPTPKKDGYIFVGWFDGSKKVDSITKITKDITLIAKWEKEEKATKKKTTKKKTTTTTTKVTTTSKKDEIGWILPEVEGSDVGQATLYLTKNGNKVSGTCTIITKTGETVDNFEVSASGYLTNVGFIKDVKNIKVN